MAALVTLFCVSFLGLGILSFAGEYKALDIHAQQQLEKRREKEKER